MNVFPKSPERILALTKKLCSIQSVSGRGNEENRAADLLMNELRQIAPSYGNTLCVKSILCRGDRLGRKAVWALLRSAKRTDRTVLLTGHFDVVDTQGQFADLAFSPDEYTQTLSGGSLPESVAQDLASGNWLFGRGTMDMKAGLALFVETIRVLATAPNLGINVAFLAVPDEESDSAGMRGSIEEMCSIMNSESLDVVAALTGEPCFWTSGKNPTRPYYTGTTGKIMPFFLCLGRASHVNDYTEGANAALLAAHVVQLFEGDPELIDGTGDDTLPPPACLRSETREKIYSVSLPERAVCFFNVLTDSKTPEEVLRCALHVAEKAIVNACGQMRHTAEVLSQKGAVVATEQETGKVLSFRDLVHLAIEKVGGEKEFLQKQEVFLKTIPDGIDARERTIRVSEWVADISGIRGPAVVVGFLPPYYPHRINKRRDEKEKLLRRIVEETAVWAGELAGDGATSVKEVFGGITDLSFLGFEGSREDLVALAENMPAWGNVYSLPMEQLLKLNIPVANMGPAGKDAHKSTERLELKFSLEIAPKLLLKTIERLSIGK